MNSNGESESVRPKHPMENASILSRITLWWIADLLKLGMKRPIAEADIYETLRSHDSKRLADELECVWQNEKETQSRPSFLRSIWQIYRMRVFIPSIVYTVLSAVIRTVQPLLLGEFITHFDDNSSPGFSSAHVYGIGIVACATILIGLKQTFVLYGYHLGITLRVACCGVIYRKAQRKIKSSTAQGFNGKVINLMSSDSAISDRYFYLVHALWKGPLELFLFGYFIHREIGYYGWLGIGFILSFIPIQMWMGKMTAKYRAKMAKQIDIRIKAMNEIIRGIQVIKMFAWEQSFAKLVDSIRKRELKFAMGRMFVQSIMVAFSIIPRIAIFLSLIVYVMAGNTFVAKQVFIVTSYFSFLYSTMLYLFPTALAQHAEFHVNVKRIEEFLLTADGKTTKPFMTPDESLELKELLKTTQVSAVNAEFTHTYDADRSKVIRFQDATALWPTNSPDSKATGLRTINLEIDRSCTIVGVVGSGKSTMFQVILGELELDRGTLVINGKLSYAAQESWLFDASIRQNILFTEVYDAKRYAEVIRVCALNRDFELFQFGDQTLVGERGITLSGGQRARINLARAIYRRADIYLLDDPLSAVDMHVGKHIYEKCIGEFLSDKIVVLITHQLQLLLNADNIILMNDGELCAHGSYAELSKSYGYLLREAATQEESEESLDEKAEKIVSKFALDQKPMLDRINRRQEAIKEQEKIGSIGLSTYWGYFKSVDSLGILLATAAFIPLEQVVSNCIDVYVSKWVNWEKGLQKHQYETEKGTNTVDVIPTDRSTYLYTYTLMVAFVLYLVFQRSALTIAISIRASRNLHDKLFRGVIRASMYFFNTNPSGRIINRFAKDIYQIDTALVIDTYESIYFILQVIGAIVVVSMTNYVILVPTVFVVILFVAMRQFMVKTSRCIKRIDATSRSPIFQHVNTTLSGSSTIRSCGAGQRLCDEFDAHQNYNITTMFLFYAIGRALAAWLDFICAIFLAAVVTVFLIYKEQSTGGSVGLAVTQIFALSAIAQWGMWQTFEMESGMTCVERIIEYSNLEPETSDQLVETVAATNSDWPKQGSIRFANVSLRYRENGDAMLKNVSFEVKANEKVGVIGRTGAGKSSIIQALFRLAYNEGHIDIDGVDISTVRLDELRRKISIIPQDPVLFSGTIRDNLDPFGENGDAELWNVLEEVELGEVVRNESEGLLSHVHDDGSNFSMGQRQLICLARAILRKNKILIMDEATANVDAKTDQCIQSTIREKFANCTVLTIAHRLHTVMDADRVLVMDAGNVVEFDHPHLLLQNRNGFLAKLVAETDDATAKHLREVAQKSFSASECEQLRIPNEQF